MGVERIEGYPGAMRVMNNEYVVGWLGIIVSSGEYRKLKEERGADE